MGWRTGFADGARQRGILVVLGKGEGTEEHSTKGKDERLTLVHRGRGEKKERHFSNRQEGKVDLLTRILVFLQHFFTTECGAGARLRFSPIHERVPLPDFNDFLCQHPSACSLFVWEISAALLLRKGWCRRW
jgi:hypothetical protein